MTLIILPTYERFSDPTFSLWKEEIKMVELKNDFKFTMSKGKLEKIKSIAYEA